MDVVVGGEESRRWAICAFYTQSMTVRASIREKSRGNRLQVRARTDLFVQCCAVGGTMPKNLNFNLSEN